MKLVLFWQILDNLWANFKRKLYLIFEQKKNEMNMDAFVLTRFFLIQSKTEFKWEMIDKEIGYPANFVFTTYLSTMLLLCISYF